MAQFVIDKRDFLKGLSQSEEIGGFFRDMQGINIYSNSGIGVLMNNSKEVGVYSEGSATPLSSPVTQLIRSSFSGTQVVFALSSRHGIGLRMTGADTDTAPNIITFTGNNIGDKRGAAMYHLGTQSNSDIGLFYSFETDIGCYDITKTFTTQGQWNEDFMSTVPASASTVASVTFRAMYHHKRHDILYWNGGVNKVDKFDANTGVNGTLTENCLDLPVNWEIRDFGQLKDFLAVLAVTPPTGGSDDANVQYKSKIFFWDGTSDSWTYETPLIHDHILRLVNTEEGLFGVGKGDGISYYRFEVEQAARLFNWVGAGSVIDLTTGRRDGNDLANYGAIDSIGNQLLFLGKDGNDGHIFTAGNRFGLAPDRVLGKAFFVKSSTGIGLLRMGDMVTVSPNKHYVSYWYDTDGSGTANAGDQFRIVRFSPGNANTQDGRADTVELDSYFGGVGRLKKLNYIRFDIDELASGDVLEIYKEIDYDNTWTRLDGTGSAGAENSIRESDFSGDSRTTIKFTR